MSAKFALSLAKEQKRTINVSSELTRIIAAMNQVYSMREVPSV